MVRSPKRPLLLLILLVLLILSFLGGWTSLFNDRFFAYPSQVKRIQMASREEPRNINTQVTPTLFITPTPSSNSIFNNYGLNIP